MGTIVVKRSVAGMEHDTDLFEESFEFNGLFDVGVEIACAEAEKFAMEQPLDLVLLDLNLQGATGLEELRTIRARKPDLPVMLLTGTGVLEERIRGLDAGADDYLSKPFAFAELAARIRAVLRRGGRPGEAVVQMADLKLDRLTHTVQRAGRTIDLSPKEFALLEFLMMHRGQPVLNYYLRRKIDSGHDRALIRTIRGVGYQISVEPAPVRAHLTVAR